MNPTHAFRDSLAGRLRRRWAPGLLAVGCLCRFHAAELPRRPLEWIPSPPLDTAPAYGNRLRAHPEGGLLVTVTGGAPESILRLDARGNRIWGQWVDATDAVGLEGGGAVVAGVAIGSKPDYVASLTWLRSDGSVLRRLPLDMGLPLPREAGFCVCSAAYGLDPLPDGGFLVVGATTLGAGNGKTSPAFGNLDGWVVRVDAEGRALWDQTYGTSQYEILERVAPRPGGGWILAGLAARPSATMLLILIDAEGNSLRERTVGPSGPWRHTRFVDMAATPTGEIFMMGNMAGSFTGPSDLLVRLDSQGNEIWSRSFRSGLNTYPSSVLVLPGGDVLLTGSSVYSDAMGRTTASTWCQRINPDGEVRWETWLPNSGDTFYRMARALPLADGRLFWITTRGGRLLPGFLEAESVPAGGDHPVLTALPEFLPSHPNGYFSLNGPRNSRVVVEHSTNLSSWTAMFTHTLGDTDHQFTLPSATETSRFLRARSAPVP